MVEMTSRERVLTALNHQEPDRVPIDIGGGSSTSIIVEGYESLKQHSGISSETKIMNRVFRVAQVEEKVMKILGSDCYPISINPPENWTPPPSETGAFIDIWGLLWKEVRYNEDCFYYELVESPLAEA